MFGIKRVREIQKLHICEDYKTVFRIDFSKLWISKVRLRKKKYIYREY